MTFDEVMELKEFGLSIGFVDRFKPDNVYAKHNNNKHPFALYLNKNTRLCIVDFTFYSDTTIKLNRIKDCLSSESQEHIINYEYRGYISDITLEYCKNYLIKAKNEYKKFLMTDKKTRIENEFKD